MADNDVKREWRVGHKVPINVYEGDRPVCQCQTAEYAALIVEAVNAHSRASQLSAEQVRRLVAAAKRVERICDESGFCNVESCGCGDSEALIELRSALAALEEKQ